MEFLFTSGPTTFVNNFYSFVLRCHIYWFKVINNTKISILFEKYNYKNFFSSLGGAYLLIFFIYPFLSLGILNKKIFIIISSIIFILGLNFIFFLIKKLKYKNIIELYSNFNKLDFVLVCAFLICYLLISLSPITHADSLAYHVIGSIEALNNGMFNTDILQSKNLLVSAGEIFMILGFALKSQEFGNVIQYALYYHFYQFFYQ